MQKINILGRRDVQYVEIEVASSLLVDTGMGPQISFEAVFADIFRGYERPQGVTERRRHLLTRASTEKFPRGQRKNKTEK